MSLNDDDPGELHLPSGVRIDVIVVSVVGLTVTLSCHEDLGDYVGRATLSSNRTALTKRLIRRIEELVEREIDNRAGARLLGEAPVGGAPRSSATSKGSTMTNAPLSPARWDGTRRSSRGRQAPGRPRRSAPCGTRGTEPLAAARLAHEHGRRPGALAHRRAARSG